MNGAFTWVFLAVLLASTCGRLWLAVRQARHVSAHRGEVPAAFAGTIPLAAHQKAADYTVAKVGLGALDVCISAAVLLALTLGGVLQWLSDLWAHVAPPFGLIHSTALIVSVLLLSGAIDLPLNLYRVFVIEERFGFNRMTLRLFLLDLAKNTMIGIALGGPLLIAVLWLMQKAGELWWLYAWILVAGYSAFIQMIYPVLVMPLFNKFSPVADRALAERVERLLLRCGFRTKGLFVMDGSKRSSHGNAFFAGFGAGKRIVLFDTLVSRLRPEEIEAVLAHELGHYKLHHIAKGMVVSSAISFALLFSLGLLVDQRWFYEALGVQTATLGAALMLFMLVVPVFLFFLQPLISLFSRKHEFEADRYAMQHASAAELEQALVKLYQDNASTLTPDPLHSAFYDSHPPAAIRIERLRTA